MKVFWKFLCGNCMVMIGVIILGLFFLFVVVVLFFIFYELDKCMGNLYEYFVFVVKVVKVNFDGWIVENLVIDCCILVMLKKVDYILGIICMGCDVWL